MSIDMQPQDTLQDRVAMEIRLALTWRSWSRRELSRRLGVSSGWVHYRLNGEQAITLDDLERIARALDTPAIDLLTRASGDKSHYRSRSTVGPRDTRPRDNRPNGRPATDSVGPAGGRPRILRDLVSA